MNSDSVSAELGVRVVSPDQTMVRLVVGLRYCSRDPYAVRIEFRTGPGQPIEWFCARELLRTGIERRAGSGDIAVWPSDGYGCGCVLHIELSSPSGRAHVQVPVWGISDFLARTYQLVPAGREREHLNIDAELADLLRRA